MKKYVEGLEMNKPLKRVSIIIDKVGEPKSNLAIHLDKHNFALVDGKYIATTQGLSSNSDVLLTIVLEA